MTKQWIGILLGVMLILSCQIASAEVEQIGPNAYVAGIPTDQIEYSVAEQRANNWCWAAASQMVLNFHGVPVSQEAFVIKVYGRLVNAPANNQQIIHAINGWGIDASGCQFWVQANEYNRNEYAIIQDLKNRQPLIVGLRQKSSIGHAYVMTAVKFIGDWMHPMRITSVILRDPWPDNPSRQEISWQEFTQRVTFMAHVYVLR